MATTVQLIHSTKVFRRLLLEGCHRGCDYDEAEGGILNHCKECQKAIVESAYTIFAMNKTRIVLEDY